MRREDQRSQRGSAMVIAMLMLLLMGLIGFAALQTVTRDLQVSGAQFRKRVAFYAAEAGIAKALETLVNFGTPDVPTTNLADTGLYPHGQPSFAVDSSAAHPIENFGVGSFPGMNLQLGQDGTPLYQMQMYRIMVEGNSDGGGLSRIEIVTGVLAAK